MNFFDHHALTTIDVQFGDNVGWTFESHSGYRAWIDHTAVSNSLLSRVLKAHTSDFVSIFQHYALLDEMKLKKLSIPDVLHCLTLFVRNTNLFWTLIVKQSVTV